MKLNIDTLFFSGGGLNCFSHLGCLKYLIELGGITPNLEGIDNIISVSGGTIIVLPLLLGYSFDETYNILNDYNIKKNIKINKLKDIIKGDGVYLNNIIIDFIKTLLINKSYDPDITLRELYLKTNKNLLLKVYNIYKSIIVYVSHENYPDIKLHTAIYMSAAAPMIFKPIRYGNQLFCDGGVGGCFPYEKLTDKKYKKYMGFWITGNNRDISGNTYNSFKKSEYNNMIDYLSMIYDGYGYVIKRNKSQRNRIIMIHTIGTGLNLNENKSKRKTFMNGYDSIKIHFKNIIEDEINRED